MPQPPSSVDLRNRYLAGLLAYLVPGLGHAYQRRYGKAILYFTVILGLYFTGLALGQWQIVYWRWINPLANSERFCFHYLGQFFNGLASLPALIQATLELYDKPPVLWGFLAEPSQNDLNRLYTVPGGRIVEVATMYTTVAGLLNILAIYDALEGPADLNQEAVLAQAQASEVAAGSASVGSNLDHPPLPQTTEVAH
jgi:hypothetical protein